MLNLANSLTKPSSLSKQRSVEFDGLVNAAVSMLAGDEGLKQPTTGAGTDRSHTYAIWLKFNNTNAKQGVFTTQSNSGSGLNILLNDSKVTVHEWLNSSKILDHEGDTVLTDAIKQDWMLWVFTHSRPADNSNGVHNVYVNGTTATYGSTKSTYNGNVVYSNGANQTSFLGMINDQAWGSNWNLATMNGRVAQLGYWTRVLTSAEIAAMHKNPKMDWRYNSGAYTSTGIQRYYKPFTNEIDDIASFKIRDLVNYAPGSLTVCDDESISSWTVILSNSKVDLGNGERKFTISGSSIASYGTSNGAGFLDGNVDAGIDLTYTFKAKIVTDSNTTATFGVFGGSTTSSTIPANQDYIDITFVHEQLNATGDLMVFLMSGTNAGDELFIKDFTVKKLVGANDKSFICPQTDQIHSDAPGNQTLAGTII